MGRLLHVSLDDRSAAALEVVRADGLDETEAVQMALQEAAARRRSRAGLRAESYGNDEPAPVGPD